MSQRRNPVQLTGARLQTEFVCGTVSSPNVLKIESLPYSPVLCVLQALLPCTAPSTMPADLHAPQCHWLDAGALVSGPGPDGSFADDRTLSAQSSVGLNHNVPLIGLLGGLLSVRVTAGQCAAGHGLFQLYTVDDLP